MFRPCVIAEVTLLLCLWCSSSLPQLVYSRRSQLSQRNWPEPSKLPWWGPTAASPWESPTRCWRRFVVRLRRDGGRQGSCMGQYGTWSMTESDDTSTRFCSCTKTTSQLSEDIMHVIICTYMHVYIRIHCTGILGGVEPCFQLVPCKHHCNHGARQVHLAYFGHWAWCQNVDNCQEPQN